MHPCPPLTTLLNFTYDDREHSPISPSESHYPLNFTYDDGGTCTYLPLWLRPLDKNRETSCCIRLKILVVVQYSEVHSYMAHSVVRWYGRWVCRDNDVCKTDYYRRRRVNRPCITAWLPLHRSTCFKPPSASHLTCQCGSNLSASLEVCKRRCR